MINVGGADHILPVRPDESANLGLESPTVTGIHNSPAQALPIGLTSAVRRPMILQRRADRISSVKAVAIDPFERRIVVEEVDPTPAELRRLCGSPRRVLATLPNGDVILAAEGEGADAGFSLGGSKAIRSSAIVLGRRNSFGDRTAARSSLEMLQGLIRWVSPISVPEPAQSGETVSVIVVDPEIGLIDRAEMGRTAAGIDHVLGGAALPLLNAPGGDIVYGHASHEDDRSSERLPLGRSNQAPQPAQAQGAPATAQTRSR